MQPDADAAKKSLRTEARFLRAEAHARQGRTAAVVLSQTDLVPFAPHWPCVVSGFLPIGDEIDLGPLMERLHAQGATLALPVIEKKAHPLSFRIWSPGDPLVDKAWGIREPLPAAATVEPDLLLVPLLAVDPDGYRLGYGGGFYDRTLARLRALKPVVAIGVAYDVQRLDAVARDVYDQPLDWLLTPSGMFRFLPNED
ncbi:MAG: 5-formyltetrahydrofolate cyclo-ligase [Hyphomicrobiaceae bacterium]|nr:5-formyltetrahydrofolate cyclo-ligase [Hyphomicrobiaceae bacterium]